MMPPLPGCDHSPTQFQYTFAVNNLHKPIQPHSIPDRSWHKGNYGAMSAGLNCLDWDLELSYLNAENTFKHFANILHCLADEFVPLKPNQVDNKTPWLKRPPSSLISRRQAAWSQYNSESQITK